MAASQSNVILCGMDSWKDHISETQFGQYWTVFYLSVAKNIALKMGYYYCTLFSEKFEEDVLKVWDYKQSVEQYQTVGGTSTSSIMHQIHVLEEWLHFAEKN